MTNGCHYIMEDMFTPSLASLPLSPFWLTRLPFPLRMVDGVSPVVVPHGTCTPLPPKPTFHSWGANPLPSFPSPCLLMEVSSCPQTNLIFPGLPLCLHSTYHTCQYLFRADLPWETWIQGLRDCVFWFVAVFHAQLGG